MTEECSAVIQSVWRQRSAVRVGLRFSPQPSSTYLPFFKPLSHWLSRSTTGAAETRQVRARRRVVVKSIVVVGSYGKVVVKFDE